MTLHDSEPPEDVMEEELEEGKSVTNSIPSDTNGTRLGSMTFNDSEQPEDEMEEEKEKEKSISINRFTRSQELFNKSVTEDFKAAFENRNSRDPQTRARAQMVLQQHTFYPPCLPKQDNAPAVSYMTRKVRVWDELLRYPETIVPGYTCPKCKALVKADTERTGWGFRGVLSNGDYFVLAFGRYRCRHCTTKFNTKTPAVMEALRLDVRLDLGVMFFQEVAFETSFTSLVYDIVGEVGPTRTAEILNRQYMHTFTNRYFSFLAGKGADAPRDQREREGNRDIGEMFRGQNEVLMGLELEKEVLMGLELEKEEPLSKREVALRGLLVDAPTVNGTVQGIGEIKAAELKDKGIKNVLDLARISNFDVFCVRSFDEVRRDMDQKDFGELRCRLAERARNLINSANQLKKAKDQRRVLLSVVEYVKLAREACLEKLNANLDEQDYFKDMADVEVAIVKLVSKVQTNTEIAARNRKLKAEAKACFNKASLRPKLKVPEKNEFGTYKAAAGYRGYTWTEQMVKTIQSVIFEERRPFLSQQMLAQPSRILSIDSTWKIGNRITVRLDDEVYKPFQSLITGVNEHGAVVLARMSENREKNEDLKHILSSFRAWQESLDKNWKLDIFYCDNCCATRDTAQEVFGTDCKVLLDPYHFMDRFTRWFVDPNGEVAGKAKRELSEAIFIDDDFYSVKDRILDNDVEEKKLRKEMRHSGRQIRRIPKKDVLYQRIAQWVCKYVGLDMKCIDAEAQSKIYSKMSAISKAFERLAEFGPIVVIQNPSGIFQPFQFKRAFKDSIREGGKEKTFEAFLTTQLGHVWNGCMSDAEHSTIYTLKKDGSMANARGTSKNERFHREVNSAFDNRSTIGMKRAEITLLECTHKWNRRAHAAFHGRDSDKYVDLATAFALNSCFREKYDVTDKNAMPYPHFVSTGLDPLALGMGLTTTPLCLRQYVNMPASGAPELLKLAYEEVDKLFGAHKGDKHKYVEDNLTALAQGDGLCGDRSILGSMLLNLNAESPREAARVLKCLGVEPASKRHTKAERLSLFCKAGDCRVATRPVSRNDDLHEAAHFLSGTTENSSELMFRTMLHVRQLVGDLIVQVFNLELNSVRCTLQKEHRQRTEQALHEVPGLKDYVRTSWEKIILVEDPVAENLRAEDLEAKSLVAGDLVGENLVGEGRAFEKEEWDYSGGLELFCGDDLLDSIVTTGVVPSTRWTEQTLFPFVCLALMIHTDTYADICVYAKQATVAGRYVKTSSSPEELLDNWRCSRECATLTKVSAFVLYTHGNHFDAVRGAEDLCSDLHEVTVGKLKNLKNLKKEDRVTVRSVNDRKQQTDNKVKQARAAADQTDNRDAESEDEDANDAEKFTVVGVAEIEAAEDEHSLQKHAAKASLSARDTAEQRNLSKDYKGHDRLTDLEVYARSTTGRHRSLAPLPFSKRKWKRRKLEFILFNTATRMVRERLRLGARLDKNITLITDRYNELVCASRRRAFPSDIILYQGVRQHLFFKTTQHVRNQLKRRNDSASPQAQNTRDYLDSIRTQSETSLPFGTQAAKSKLLELVSQGEVKVGHLQSLPGVAHQAFRSVKNPAEHPAAPYETIKPGVPLCSPPQEAKKRKRTKSKARAPRVKTPVWHDEQRSVLPASIPILRIPSATAKKKKRNGSKEDAVGKKSQEGTNAAGFSVLWNRLQELQPSFKDRDSWIEDIPDETELDLLRCLVSNCMRLVYKAQVSLATLFCTNNDLVDPGGFWATNSKQCNMMQPLHLAAYCRVLKRKNEKSPDMPPAGPEPSFYHSAYLDDTVIDSSLWLLRTKLWTSPRKQVTWTFINTNVIRLCQNPTDKFMSTTKPSHRGKNFDKSSTVYDAHVLDKPLVLIPLCIGYHWVLVTANPIEKLISYYDSMHVGGINKKHVKLAHKILTTYVQRAQYKLNSERDRMGGAAVDDDFLNFNKWTIAAGAAIEQPNSIDCGTMVIAHSQFLVRGLNPAQEWEKMVTKAAACCSDGAPQAKLKRKACDLARERLALTLLTHVWNDLSTMSLETLRDEYRPRFKVVVSEGA